jgi:hypothetical protein
MKDPLCDIDTHHAKILCHVTRSYGSMVVTTSLTILAHQSRSAQGRVHFITTNERMLLANSNPLYSSMLIFYLM